MNRVCLIGRQVRESSVKQSTSGKKFLEGVIAVSDGANNNATFIDYTAFDKTAEIIGAYVKKGDLFGIDGRLTVASWDGKDGNKKYKTFVTVERVDLSGSKEPKRRPDEEELAGFFGE